MTALVASLDGLPCSPQDYVKKWGVVGGTAVQNDVCALFDAAHTLELVRVPGTEHPRLFGAEHSARPTARQEFRSSGVQENLKGLLLISC